MAKLVVGCGYLGRRVADRWLAAGETVFVTTRSPEQAAALATEGLTPLVLDVTRPETLAGLPLAETVLWAVGFDRSAGRTRADVYVDGLRAVLDALTPATRRIIAISSTGVHGQTDGQWIDEDTPCQPTREAGVAFVEAEQMLSEHPLGARAVVLRLAGLYGPARLPRLDDLLAGRPLAVPENRYLNLIHVDDAAAVVLAAEALAKAPRTYLVSDGHPVDRRAYYGHLADLLHAPPPRFIEPTPETLASHHAGANKRIDNRRMILELGVRLTHPSYREGLAAALAE